MAFNPLMLAKLKPMWGKFKSSHSDFLDSLKSAARGSLKEGSVITITIADPQGNEKTSQVKLNAKDVEMMETLKDMFS
ncbi:MAG: hypothetical protein ACOX4I_00195 [Anaerovoracaceae bacterium]